MTSGEEEITDRWPIGIAMAAVDAMKKRDLDALRQLLADLAPLAQQKLGKGHPPADRFLMHQILLLARGELIAPAEVDCFRALLIEYGADENEIKKVSAEDRFSDEKRLRLAAVLHLEKGLETPLARSYQQSGWSHVREQINASLSVAGGDALHEMFILAILRRDTYAANWLVSETIDLPDAVDTVLEAINDQAGAMTDATEQSTAGEHAITGMPRWLRSDLTALKGILARQAAEAMKQGNVNSLRQMLANLAPLAQQRLVMERASADEFLMQQIHQLVRFRGLAPEAAESFRELLVEYGADARALKKASAEYRRPYSQRCRLGAIKTFEKGLKTKLARIYKKGGWGKALDQITAKRTAIADDAQSEMLTMAILRRDRTAAEWLVSEHASLRAAADTALDILNDETYDATYGREKVGPGERVVIRMPRWMLNDLAKLQSRGQTPFWEDMAVFGETANARRLALEKLREAGGSKAVKNASSRRIRIEEAMRQQQDAWRHRTKTFRMRIQRLFKKLREHGIFAVDAYNGGWEPNDNWFNTVEKAMCHLTSEEEEYFRRHAGSDEFNVCFVDTEYGRRNSTYREDGQRLLSRPSDSAVCCYHARSKRATKAVARKIVEMAPACNLNASWDGDVAGVIVLFLPIEDSAHDQT